MRLQEVGSGGDCVRDRVASGLGCPVREYASLWSSRCIPSAFRWTGLQGLQGSVWGRRSSQGVEPYVEPLDSAPCLCMGTFRLTGLKGSGLEEAQDLGGV